MAQVKITWKAFGEDAEENRFITSVEFDYPVSSEWKEEQRFLDELFEATNLYSGKLWNVIQPKLSPVRTHTALSVGDEIEIAHDTYRVLYLIKNTKFEVIEIIETTGANK